VAVRPEAVTSGELAEAVWADRPPPRSASHAVQTHVRRVRQALGDAVVMTVESGYRLATDVAVDVDAFERAFDEASVLEDPPSALKCWSAALAHWRGDPYPELVDWPRSAPERARLGELFHVAQEETCAAQIGVGVLPATAADIERLAQAEPLRERRWVLLMLALDAGGRRAEGLRTFDRARRVLAAELGVSPGRELTSTYETLVRADESADRTEPDAPLSPVSGGWLPAPLSDLIGRADDVAAVAQACQRQRLVTLTGVGGVGKSRVAVAAAASVGAAASGGAWFIGLAAARDGADVEAIAAAALGVAAADSRPVREVVVQAIGARRMLLLIDNCEHVLDAAAEFAVEVLARCPHVHVLATSRTPLKILGERTIQITPLALDGAACELFVARGTDAGVHLDAALHERVVEIVRHLAGIPLLIELGAAQLRTFGLEELTRRLADRVDVVGTNRRGGVAHHRTVRATLRWSFDLLSHDQQRLFARLGRFVGSFDLDAVEHVATALPLGDDVGDHLAILVEASMIVAEQGAGTSFRLLEPLRRFALEQLGALGETDELTWRHAVYYAELAEQLAAQLEGPAEVAAAQRLQHARDNLRVAFGSAMASGDVDTALRIAVALGDYASSRVWAEPWAWCRQALAALPDDPHPHRAAAQVHAASGAWQLGDHATCVALAEQAMSASKPGDGVWREAQRVRAGSLMWLGRLDDALTALRDAIADEPDRRTAASIRRRSTLALVLNHIGIRDEAVIPQLLDDALALAHPTSLATAHHTAGVVLGAHDRALARRHQTAAAQFAATSGAILIRGFALSALAMSSHLETRAQVQAIADVTQHYLQVGNHTHLRSFARVAIAPLAATGSWEAVILLDAATRDQPTFRPHADQIIAACAHARDHLRTSDALTHRGEAMTDDELVAWLRTGTALMPSTRAAPQTGSAQHAST